MTKKKDERIQVVSWDETRDNYFELPLVSTGIQPVVDWQPAIPKVDSWLCPQPFKLFTHMDKHIIVPVSKFYGIEDPNNPLNMFNISIKRCYNRIDMREHTCQYLNYFNYFYDPDSELYLMYAKIKYMIDVAPVYTQDDFIRDIKKYILYNRSILFKVFMMDSNNYHIELDAKKGRSVPSLQYRTKHGHILMQMSILMNIVIPLVTHFAYTRNLEPIDDVLLTVFDMILYMSDVDIYSKFYETATSEVGRSKKLHKMLWDMQSIRGINDITHANDSIINIILNIMPKYIYSENTISFNCTAIRNSTKFKITGIRYEYNFQKLSSSNKDADCQSDFDKYESYLIRQDEALFLQNSVNCEQSLLYIEEMYGPFDKYDIEYYKRRLKDGSPDGSVFNKFQRKLIFLLCDKYFGDPKSIYSINEDGYIKLMMASKKILDAAGAVVLSYLISSKIIRMPSKKSINKRYLDQIIDDDMWKLIEEKYKDDEISKTSILENIGVLVSSDFIIIAPHEPDVDNKIMESNNHMSLLIAKEYLDFVLTI